MKDIIWHYGIGYDRHGNNRNLCNRQGAATNMWDTVTCKKCQEKKQIMINKNYIRFFNMLNGNYIFDHKEK